MKSQPNNSAPDKQDLLLFEYLEGELSGSRKSELEERLMLDPDLLEEMEYWKESFMDPEFYNTDKLEKSLLNIPAGTEVKSWYSYASLNIFLMVLLSGLFSFLPLSEDEEKLIPAAFRAGRVKVIHQADKEPATFNAPEGEKIKPLFGNAPAEKLMLNILQEIPAETSSSAELALTKIPEINALAPEGETFFPEVLLPAPEVKKHASEKAAPRTISRKEERKILRKKEKALQNRQAREFMKGNRAYVVPLNTENF